MVKLGKAFSILVVFALLILLAPVAILAPPQNVSAAGEAVTEEIEAGFSFNVTSGGAWHTFTVGSGGIQGDPVTQANPRLCLAQYTRQNVVIPNATPPPTVPDCGFRNYTTGSGSVASTVGNLTGTMTLEWMTFRFNYTHPDPYAAFDDFGWMAGRGHIDEGGGDSIAFVFVADLDCNDDMTVAAGKGFMQSVEENGRFGNMSDPPEQRHHIMGDFDIALSGGTYTGNFHLRNYPPNEVYDEGALNITGGVQQEFTDDINPGLEILNMTSDGPMSTPYDTFYETGFEEIDWGRDPIKKVLDSPRLGPNGTMNLSRNSVLYLNQTVIGSDTYVRIQGTPVCMLYIDDTYAVTGDDDSAYGELWEILLLSLPYQMLIVDPGNPNFFNQTGYTFCPFGTVNGQPTSQTECYAGAESFADAVIYIEATVGIADQFSHDVTYGLCAHPKVESVSPAAGFVGQTMPVTITGKYFLRAENYTANSGSVDFGPNITVNSYTINNPTSPIDNSITASITIDPLASPGVRDVNVTSCFGYANGTATDPYKSGVLADSFTVSPLTRATLQGQVSFKARGAAGSSRWVEPFVVKGFEQGNLSNVLWSDTVVTDTMGGFILTNLTPGTYDIGIKNWTCLSEVEDAVVLSDGVTTPVDFGYTREGDIASPENDWVTSSDLSRFCSAYNSKPGDANWNRNADLDRSNWVSSGDLSLFCANYNLKGDAYGHFV